MAVTVTIDEAKAGFGTLLERALTSKEEVVISDNGTPVARLVPTGQMTTPSPRKPGSAKGLFVVPPDFNDSLPDEVLDLFEA